MPEEVIEVVPGPLISDDAVPVTADEMLPIGNTFPVISEALSLAEVQSLEHYEEMIAEGIKTFVTVGGATVDPRAAALSSVLLDVSNITPTVGSGSPYAYRLMMSAVVEHLLPIGGTLPVNEAQARPSPSPTEQQQEVWQEVVGTAPPSGITAKHVQATVKR